MRTYKRYQNSKIYDSKNSYYVSHEEILTVVKNGEDIEIIDNGPETDITYDILLQAIFEVESKKTEKDIKLLLEVIKTSGSFTSFIQEKPVISIS